MNLHLINYTKLIELHTLTETIRKENIHTLVKLKINNQTNARTHAHP